MDKVAVVQGLQAEVSELQVSLRQQGLAQQFQVELPEVGCQQLQRHTFFDIGGQGTGIQRGHVGLGGAGGHAEKSERLGAQVVTQQAGRDVGVIGLLLDHGAGGDNQGRAQLRRGHAVVQVFQRLIEDPGLTHITQVETGFADDGVDTVQVQRCAAAVRLNDVDIARRGLGRRRQCLLGGALAGLLLPVDDVIPGDFVLAGAHQRQLDLVLDILDVDGAARGHTSLEGGGDLFGQAGDGFMDAAGGGGCAALHRQEGLGDRH